MILHHPSKELLLEYSAGSLGKAPSIAIATHLQFCSQCRQQVRELNRLGSTCWDAMANHDNGEHVHSSHHQCDNGHPPIAPVDNTLFEKVMAECAKHDAKKAIDTHSSPANTPSPSNVVSLGNTPKDHEHHSEVPHVSHLSSAQLGNHRHGTLPLLVKKLIQQSQPLRWRHLSPSIQVARLTAGQQQYEVSLIKIKAGGRVLEHDHKGNEWTLVLDGAFSDHQGVYQAGDFLQQSPGHVHAPQATANKDCLCLSVTEAPIQFTGWLSRLFNPFLSVQAR